MNATTGNNRSAAMRASDADRDEVVSDLSQHFQAGRLTAEEFDERSGRALTARTWGELGGLLADLPAASAPADTSASVRPRPPAIAILVGLGITALVLVNVAHGDWGSLWLLFAVLFIARRVIPSWR